MLKKLDDRFDNPSLPDIKPQTPVRALNRDRFAGETESFPLGVVAAVTGMSETFIGKILGRVRSVSAPQLLQLLDQDAFSETFVPRSMVLDYLLSRSCADRDGEKLVEGPFRLVQGNALDVIRSLPARSLQCVVTSTPYWAMRIYKDSRWVRWADGSFCPYGHEQTPEEFVRHSTEILYELIRTLCEGGSIWWNVMDSYNTRTQIRGNAAEALKAMQGKDERSWKDHECRRYSAGHSYLKDGEQSLIPGRIAERASRMGLYVKAVITWAKTSSLPEPQNSRVSRNLEYVLHLSKVRNPLFKKDAYRTLPASLGGRNGERETDKLSDVWVLPTSAGRDGHGAQFPLALPARCIALSTEEDDVVFDPFAGSGNSGVAALRLGRRFLGVDVSADYLATAHRKLSVVARA